MEIAPVYEQQKPKYPARGTITNAFKKACVGTLCVASIVTCLGAVSVGAVIDEEPMRVAGGYLPPNLDDVHPLLNVIKPPEVNVPAVPDT